MKVSCTTESAICSSLLWFDVGRIVQSSSRIPSTLRGKFGRSAEASFLKPTTYSRTSTFPLIAASKSCYRHSIHGIMASLPGRLQGIFAVLYCLAILPFSSALKFDLQAHTGHSSKYERCIRNFVAKDTLVVVTATVSGQKGDGQMVNMHVSSLDSPGCEPSSADASFATKIKDAVGNEYGKPKDIVGESRMAFTSHADAAFDVCFENILKTTRESPFSLTFNPSSYFLTLVQKPS